MEPGYCGAALLTTRPCRIWPKTQRRCTSLWRTRCRAGRSDFLRTSSGAKRCVAPRVERSISAIPSHRAGGAHRFRGCRRALNRRPAVVSGTTAGRICPTTMRSPESGKWIRPRRFTTAAISSRSPSSGSGESTPRCRACRLISFSAIIAIEDQRFYDHGGFDVLRTASAALSNLRRVAGRTGRQHHHAAARPSELSQARQDHSPQAAGADSRVPDRGEILQGRDSRVVPQPRVFWGRVVWS